MKNYNPDENQSFLSLAVDLAKKNIEKGGGPFGAVIVKQGNLISSAVNQVTLSHDPTAHAEVMAIRKASEKLGNHDLSDCVIYSSTEPCPMCLGAIYWAGIKKLVFASGKADAEKAGFIDAHIYREMGKEIDKRELDTVQMQVPGAGDEFKAWIEKMDKTSY